MKVVIWCGGRGTRLNEMTELVPKPIIEVGGKPILWHIMKIYSHFGYNEFILCLGYKGDLIKDYFTDVSRKEDWDITFVNTGLETLTGGRLLKVKKILENEDTFMATYGDGLSDIDINKLLSFHMKKGKMITITGGHPYSKWGMIKTDSNNIIRSFWQKPVLTDYINIGFMVFNKEVFNFIKDDVEIEEVFKKLVEYEQVVMFPHNGFFHAMDTYRDYLDFNKMWETNQTPWKVWK